MEYIPKILLNKFAIEQRDFLESTLNKHTGGGAGWAVTWHGTHASRAHAGAYELVLRLGPFTNDVHKNFGSFGYTMKLT